MAATAPQTWRCEARVNTRTGSARCDLYAKVGVLATQRHLCAYHAAHEDKVYVTQEYWMPGELDEMWRRATGAPSPLKLCPACGGKGQVPA